MQLVLSGLVAALAAALVSVVYQWLGEHRRQRSDLALEVCSWSDDIYDRMHAFHVQRDFMCTKKGEVHLTPEEDRTNRRRLKSLVLSSVLPTKVELVYCRSEEFRTFLSLRQQYEDVFKMLLTPPTEGWSQRKRIIEERFANAIDPLRASVQTTFITGVQPGRLIREVLIRTFPTFSKPFQHVGRRC